jgi:calcium-dependent protein kinase
MKLPLKLSLDPKNLVYHSPEIIQGEYDEKSDVWAIGIVLFYVLCGDLPF